MSNLKLICILNHVIFDALLNIWLEKHLLDVIIIVLVILISTFPSNHFEESSIILIELDNKLELKHFVAILYVCVRDLGLPDMPLAPSHPHASLAIVGVRVPASHGWCRSEHP